MPGKQDASHKNSHGKRKWSGSVTTDSTHPREGLFNKDAKTIARELVGNSTLPFVIPTGAEGPAVQRTFLGNVFVPRPRA
jgi:hypothetical protein